MKYCSAFVDNFEEITDLRENDTLLFDRKNSTISFKRLGSYLKFYASPSKDSCRHVFFIQTEKDFNELALLLSKINGLGGERIENIDNFLIWKFTKAFSKKTVICDGAVIVFDPSLSLIRINPLVKEFDSIETRVSFLKSENDLFELANLIATLNECLCREVEEEFKNHKHIIDLIPL